VKTFLIAIVLTGWWQYNESANELEYWTGSPAHTCGFVSRSNIDQGWFTVDVLASGGAAVTESMEFNTLDSAKAYVEKQCGGVK
jgi:hypothetical protein